MERFESVSSMEDAAAPAPDEAEPRAAMLGPMDAAMRDALLLRKFSKALADGILEPDDYERLVAQLRLGADAAAMAAHASAAGELATRPPPLPPR